MKREPFSGCRNWTGSRSDSAQLIPKRDLPFNLAGEPLDESLTAEGEARVRALAESEARKAQRVFPLHDDTNEGAI